MIEDAKQLASDARLLAAEVRRNPMDVAAVLDGLAREAEIMRERITVNRARTAADRASLAIRHSRRD